MVIGGSPLRLFRLTDAGATLVDRAAAGDDVGDSALTERLVDGGVLHPVPDPQAGPFTAADVTVVVPAFGLPAQLPARDALVVDDGSPSPVAGAAVRLDVNAGPAAARNAGLDLVRTPLVAFVDADVTLHPGWLDALLPHFVDPRVALVAPRVASTPGAGLLPRYEADHSPLDLGTEPARVRAGSRVSYVPSAAIVCRADALREVGGFDAGLRVGEDVDLCWRLDAAGWRCRYEPAVTVEHAPRSTWGGWWRQRVTYGSSAAPLAERHPGALAPLRMSGWSLAAWLLATVGPLRLGRLRLGPLAGSAVGLGTAAALVRKLPDVPARVAFGLAARGNAAAGAQIAAAVRRAWWPVVALAALRSKAARKVLVASAIAAGHPIRAADDVAYSVGLWRGMRRRRTIAPLVPEIRNWP